ncbi:hypothetical protein [Saccharopolyspora shandongensis]|uniref:hypothetical protein n=1 Tax=Saccharopolyspora shandongensis TaxID=418495 RepID=UPI0033E870E3
MVTRVTYARSVHDEAEINAALEVLRGGPPALTIGENVGEMERRVAELYRLAGTRAARWHVDRAAIPPRRDHSGGLAAAVIVQALFAGPSRC